MSLSESNAGKSGSASSILNKQWWRVCFVHGDQTKFYRQLYGKRAAIRTQIRDPASLEGADTSMDVSMSESLNTSIQFPQPQSKYGTASR